MDSSQIVTAVREALLGLQQAKVEALIREGLQGGLDPLTLVNEAVTQGLAQLGRRFEDEEIFLPELIIGGKIGARAIEIIEPFLKSGRAGSGRGLFLIGTVAGDVHEIGKNLVRLMSTIAGYQVVDLGMDVPNEKFVHKVAQLKPRFLGLSALLSTTIVRQKEVIELLDQAGLRDKVKVLVGGAPVHQRWAEQIGADGYAENAVGAVKELERLAGLH